MLSTSIQAVLFIRSWKVRRGITGVAFDGFWLFESAFKTSEAECRAQSHTGQTTHQLTDEQRATRIGNGFNEDFGQASQRPQSPPHRPV